MSIVGRGARWRSALVHAAIEAPARAGERGLAFRAVDAEGTVPVGTGNHCASRDDVWTRADARVHMRLQPDEAAVVRRQAGHRARETGASGLLATPPPSSCPC
ncbi:hypothetical protein [Streptomyces cinereospinus]|uniref:Uncharacterized protein n=1 Tax=Streptomyces cinereospinus TaxID=285561 RepID=A0ABV5N667_9ACTN